MWLLQKHKRVELKASASIPRFLACIESCLLQLRRDLSDIPVLRQITETLGSEVWYNTVLILTHARSQGPLGPNNQPLPFDALTQTRAAMLSRAIQ